MIRWSRAVAFCLMALGLAGGLAAAQDAGRPADAGARPAEGEARDDEGDELVPTPAPSLPTLAEDQGRGRAVYIVPIHGTIDLGLAPFIDRVLEQAEGAAAVILDIDTFGGRVDAAVRIRDALLEADVPVIAFVDRRAISAGALIALAADYIVFTPGATMGAATPIQLRGGEAEAVEEKMVSYMRSEMRATAEATGRRGEIAEAMVDADVAIPGVTTKGKLLTVTTDLATKVGLANAVVPDIAALLARLGLSEAERVRPETNWAERVARFLTDPTVSSILMSLGMLGLLIELYTPGFGIAGGLGLLCLVLFFGGHMVVELAGWEEVILFVAGLIALGVEIFVIPGFGIAGVVGIALIIISLVMASLGMPLGEAWDVGAFGGALGRVLITLFFTAVLLLLALRFLPGRGAGGWLVLHTTIGRQRPTVGPVEDSWESAPETLRSYLGRTGRTLTALRPAGKVRIGDDVVDVVSRGEWIERDAPVRVIDVEGVRVVVARVEPPAPGAGEES